MQNVVNLHTPFLYNGEPIVNGRVYFVKDDTSALTFDQVLGLDNAFFVPVYDKDGTVLENPLSLDSEGCFSVQPFVDDGLDFKMIVCRPTGVDADLNDETPAWDVAYTMVSKSQTIEIQYGGIDRVASIAALREKDPSVGSVLVLGYNAANDFCPPRIFTWKSANISDNGGTHIRSTLQEYQNAGVWVCEPSYYVDVRWFGVQPGTNASNTDCWTVVNNIVTSYYPDLPIYFPKGYYWLSDDVTVNSALVLDNGAYIRPYTKNITITVNRLENRGGQFQYSRLGSGRPYKKILVKTKGEFRSSWYNSPQNQLDNSSMANVTDLVFDSNVAFDSETTFSNKRVLVKNGVTLTNAKFINCEVFYEQYGRHVSTAIETGGVVIDEDVELVTSRPSVGVVEFFIKVLGERIISLKEGLCEIASTLKIPLLRVGDEEDNFQDGWVDIGTALHHLVTLCSRRAWLKTLLTTTLKIDGTITHAKSGRKRIDILYDSSVSQGYVKVTVPGVVTDFVLEKDNGAFNLGMVVVDQQYIDIFSGARDFDLFIEGGYNSAELKFILPNSSGEKIVGVYASMAPLYNTVGSFVEQVNGIGFYQDAQLSVGVAFPGPTATDPSINRFVGRRVLRKEESSIWVYDAFAI